MLLKLNFILVRNSVYTHKKDAFPWGNNLKITHSTTYDPKVQSCRCLCLTALMSVMVCCTVAKQFLLHQAAYGLAYTPESAVCMWEMAASERERERERDPFQPPQQS